MQARIYFNWPDGTEDSIIIEADKALMPATISNELNKRGATYSWSEVLAEDEDD